MAINNFGLLQPNQPLTEADKLLADINNFNNTVIPNLPPLVTPPVNVPKYTKFGDNLATLGGFGDQPGELLTQNELLKMNQDQIDAYNKTRKRARTQGIGELLMRFGDALQGKNATQLAYGRQQVKDQEQAKAAYQQAIKIAEASGDFQKANLLRSLGFPGFQQLQQQKAIAEFGIGKDSSPSQAKLYKLAQEQGYKGSLIDFIQLQKQSTNINLNQGNFNKLGQELAADDYKQSRIRAADANAVLTNVDTLENLLNQGVNTGFGANLSLGLQRIGQSILGEDYNVPEIAGREAFQAASTQLILPLVKQLGVNPTDKDLDFVRTGSAELGKSETGNKLMLAALRLSANRRVDEQIFNQNFYAQPENQNATIYQRDIAFEEHKRNNPELYTSITLQEAYDNLLLNQATNVISTNNASPF